jgi:hypothetical protein
LQKLLGNGADMLMQEIYERLMKQLGIDYEPGAELSPVDKNIERVKT